jgi:inner membrane transporter RhtA
LTRPVLLVLGAVASVQFGAALAVTLFDDVGPVGTVLLRLALGAVVLIALWRPSVRDLARRDVLLFGVALAGMNGCYYLALDRIDQGVAVTFEMAGPLGVAIAGSRRPLDLAWVALAGAGVVLLTGGLGSELDWLGVAFAVTAGGFWAAYILLSARVGRALPGASGLALAMVAGASVVAAPAAVQGGGDLLAPGILATGAAVAVLSSVIPYSLEMEALRAMPPRVFGVLMSLEPAAAALAGFVVLGQDMRAAEIGAIALVVTASAGAARTAGHPAPPLVVD